MSQGLAFFDREQWSSRMDHPAYANSMLVPVSPQWVTSEALMGAAYRRYVLGVTEMSVNRQRLKKLPQDISTDSDEQGLWQGLLSDSGGLRSPVLTREKGDLLQVMPLVPNLAMFGCVLGGVNTHRWDPGSFIDSALLSGVGPAEYGSFVSQFQEALDVGSGDDLFARFVQQALDGLRVAPAPEQEPSLVKFAWRNGSRSRFALSPAERMTRDLRVAFGLKPILTRRQWTAILESVLRLGLGTHELWLARLNWQVWEAACAAARDGEVPARRDIESWWTSHREGAGLVELGAPFRASLSRQVAQLFQARLGLDLLLSSMDEAKVLPEWALKTSGDKKPSTADTDDSVGVLESFLQVVAQNRVAVRDALDAWQRSAHQPTGSLRSIANSIADMNQNVAEAKAGFTKNVTEFVTYLLQQLVPSSPDDMAYDQGYVARQRGSSKSRSPWFGCLGPSVLVFAVHACCSELGEAPGTLDDLQDYLRDYGIEASMNELQSGETGQNLIRLGLVADSPDATSGRLLVNPFLQLGR